MLPPIMEKLLVLQDRDQHRLSLEAQLHSIPRDVAAIDQAVAAEKSAIEAARQELLDLELKKKALESQIASAAETLAKYKSQQLQVRKNDEYQALGVEIDHKQGEVDTAEEEELRVMYAIDDARRRFAAAEAEMKQNIAGHEGRIRLLREREAGLQAELEGAQAKVEEARALVDGGTLRLYDRLMNKPGPPAVVPIHDGRCDGCHLRVSFNLDSESRKADKVVTCDQCGRIVFWEA